MVSISDRDPFSVIGDARNHSVTDFTDSDLAAHF